MSAREQQMAELLERYVDALETNPNAQPPEGLDPQVAAAFRQMEQQLAAPGPDPEYVASFRAQLDRAAGELPHSALSPSKSPRAGLWSLRRWSFAGALTVLLVAAAALGVWVTRPQVASAQELLIKARNAASDLQSVGVKTFEMTQINTETYIPDPNAPPMGQTRSELKTWYAGPTRWRSESHFEAPNQPPLDMVTVSDGTTQYNYNATDKTLNLDAADPKAFPSPSVLSLDLLEQDMSNCYAPKVVGEETVAGRPTFKVDLGPAKCRSASMPQLNGDHIVWLDKETFFVLKSEIHAVNSDQVTSALEVTTVRYNHELSESLLTFTPPAGTRVSDNRAKPAPSASDYVKQLAVLAQTSAFPLFTPGTVPGGLVPRAPRLNSVENQLELAYVPPAEASTNSPADMHGVSIFEKRADYELVRAWTDGTEPIEINRLKAWLRRGDFDPNTGLGSNSAVVLVRDGTVIELSSFTVKPNQLVNVAASLAPVPGGHAPLPNPTPPTLAEIRGNADYPYWVPTYVPRGLMPEPPTSHQLQYHRADGSIALIVQNAKQGEGGMEQNSRAQADKVKLSNGTMAFILGANSEVIILWWDKDGGYVSLEGHGIPQSEMLKIAASMSRTADLGPTEEPKAPPTPTPVPGPAFTLVRPTWMPEPMTESLENITALDGKTPGVILRFDPHPGGEPHDVLNLTELPKQFAETIDDPQAVKQTINGNTVTIVKRGAACISHFWVQGDLALTLVNAYDPPGQPRYPCDQMAKIIASIR